MPGSHGFKEATTDEERIRRWWREHPDANIGLRTGDGVAVLDVDPRNGGTESLERLEAEHGKLPATLAVVTGGGGQHFYFGTIGQTIKSGSDVLGRGLDIKAEGGYVVAPGSTHESGKPYCWDLSSGVDEPADAPEWLLNLVIRPQARLRSNGQSDSRHWHLLAQTMRERNRYDQAETLRRALDCAIGRELVAEGRQAEIKRMVAGAYAKPAASEFRLTDGGNAERFVAAYGDAVRFCHTRRRWYVWSGRHWQWDESGEADRLAKSIVLSMYAEAAEVDQEGVRKSIVAHARQSDRADKIRSMLELARSEEAVAATDRRFDTDPWLLNVENGTLDLRTCDLREHRPSEMLTHMLPVPYEPKARFGRWLNFLLEVFDGDEELTEYVQRAAGYSLTGLTREQCFFLLYGTGANGKSTFLEVIRALLATLAQSARFESFLVRRGESIPNDIARMRGARFVTAIESEDDRRLSESTIKSLTGGDTVTARFMRSEFFDFKPEFKLWLAANHKPVVRGTDLAIWRRVKLVPFTVTIPEHRRDSDLPAKLLEELPGVLAWAVEGCRKL